MTGVQTCALPIFGNSDMHLKNFSLIQNKEGVYQLSPVYDQLPVNIIMSKDFDQMALTLNGKKRNLRRGDFLKFAHSIGIEKKTAERLIERMLKNIGRFLEACEQSFLPEEEKENVKRLILERAESLHG